MTLADLRAWYRRWYAPNNATLVVVGDVAPEQVYRLAQRYFGPLKAGPNTAPAPKPEVRQRGVKRLSVRMEAKLPYLIMAYKVPVLKTAMESGGSVPEGEAYALEVLAGLLNAGNSARLHRRLVRDRQIAASASAEYDLVSRLAGLFVLEGVPAQGRSVAELEAALREEIGQLRDHAVEPHELQRVKTQVISNHVYQRDSLFYQAMQIGQLVTVGLDWRLKDKYVDSIKSVTAAQVQAAARAYLIDDGLTVAVLEPIVSGPVGNSQ